MKVALMGMFKSRSVLIACPPVAPVARNIFQTLAMFQKEPEALPVRIFTSMNVYSRKAYILSSSQLSNPL
jgi:hypothetical protein